MPVKTDGRDLNHVAWLYDPLVEKLSFGRERRFREKTLRYVDLKDARRILDVGCGTGSLTLLLAEQATTEDVVGIDAAPKMIAIARKKADKKDVPVRFAVQAAEDLKFADATFDTVVNSMFAHHVNHVLKKRAFAEMFRVLRPGGQLVSADIDRPTTTAASLLGWSSRYLLLQPELIDNLRGRLPKIMHGAGFTDVRRHETVYGLVSFFTARKPPVGAFVP